MKKLIIFLVALFLPIAAWGLTPIARTNVVPYQRIEYGTSFNFGVVAFSKAGIDRVEFTISGQGYSGGLKTSTAMALNTRHAHTSTNEIAGHTGWDGVWEYYVTISASEFTSNGAITVTPVVYGDDAGTRTLSATTLIVEGASAYTHNYAYADSVNGNDSTCSANQSVNKCETIGKAVALAQTANSGASDGNIIYVEEGTYTLDCTITPSTTSEWLTIKNAPGASRDNIIINSTLTTEEVGGTDLLKLDGLTLYVQSAVAGTNQYKVLDGDATGSTYWTNNCKHTSIGRWLSQNIFDNPQLYPVVANTYSTNDFYYDTDRGASGYLEILRNATAKLIGEDFNRNSYFLVNIRLDDQDNGSNDGVSLYYHSDAQQNFSRAKTNEIIYNFYGTDLHYQGLFQRETSQNPASDGIAYVNCFIEMREPANDGGGGNYQLSPGAWYFDSATTPHWNHLLIWHSSFPYKHVNFYLPNSSGQLTNSSLIGNIFYEFRSFGASAGVESTPLEYGNSDSNEALYNHYKGSYTEVTGCAGNPQPSGCPQWYSKAPDSSNGRTTFSHGGLNWPEVLDLTDTTYYVDFGMPDLALGNNIANRMPSNLTGVPADALGNARDSTPDIGAMELTSGDSTPPTIDSVTIKSNGAQIIVNFSEPVQDAGDGSTWSLTMTKAAVTLSNPSVLGDEITYDLSRTVWGSSHESFVSMSYTQGVVQDTSGNKLAAIPSYSGTFTNRSDKDPIAATGISGTFKKN